MPTLEVSETKKQKNPWVKVVFATAAVLILAGVAAAVWSIKAAEDKRAYDAIIIKQNKAGLTRDYSGAIKEWEQYLSRPQPRNFDYEANLRIALLYETLKQPQKALERYRIVEKMHHEQGAAVPEGIARTSERLGDLTTAVKYYQKCADMYRKAGDRVESDWMTDKVDRLKKSMANAGK